MTVFSSVDTSNTILFCWFDIWRQQLSSYVFSALEFLYHRENYIGCAWTEIRYVLY